VLEKWQYHVEVSTHGVDEKYTYSVFKSATFTWSARKMIKLSKRKYQTMQSGSIGNNIGKYMQEYREV
jgi:hypothetical protein